MIDDFKQLWRTRHGSGFPRPFQWSPRPRSKRLLAKQIMTGHIWYSSVPLWRQIVGIPLRPYRWVRMVRGIAAVRNQRYSKYDYDDVP